MKRFFRVLLALVAGRRLITVVLGVFYVASFLMVVPAKANARGAIFGLLAAIPTAGYFAIATERLFQYANAGAVLGIPRHAATLRQAQLGIVGLFLVAPAVIGVVLGGPVSWLMLLCVPAALGTLLIQYPRWAFAGWLALALGAQVLPRMRIPWISLHHEGLRVVLTVGSLAILTRWISVADRIAARAGSAFAGLADRKHERVAQAVGEGQIVRSARLQQILSRHGARIDSIATEATKRGVTISVLSAALAVDVRPQWRLLVRLAGIGWVAMAIARLIFRPESTTTVFLVVTVIAAMQLLNAVALVYGSWRVRGPEQCLLVLTPSWPAESAVKTVFLRLILTSQSSAWLAWTLTVTPFAAIDWIPWKLVAVAALGLVAASCAACGAMCLALARRRTKNLSIATITLLLCGVIGVAMVCWSTGEPAHLATLGLVMILAPAVIGLVALWLRPLQFPVQRVDAA